MDQKTNNVNAEAKQMLSPDQLLDMAKKGEIQVEYTDKFPTTFSQENIQRFVRGEITWGELQGMDLQQAYSIADVAYTLLEQGRYNDAQTLFEGLVMCNPNDAYFHTMLGVVYAKKDLRDQAIEEYSVALKQDPKNITALVNRGELQLQQGKIEQAVADLKNAIEFDPKSENPSCVRARALAAAIGAIAANTLKDKQS